MSRASLPRVMLAGTHSGSGKTTVTCGLLRALTRREIRPSAFKCGPDYIDPMFHSRVLGVPSRNLDLFLAGEPLVRSLLAQNAAGADLAVLEGVMGYYDGLAGISTDASSWAVARATDTPVVLVVDGAGASVSTAAQVKGFAAFRADSRVAAVLLNRVSAPLYPSLKAVVEAETGLPVVGFLPRLPECAIESRHLGLIPAGEITDLRQKIDRLADELSQTVDLDALLAVARAAPPLDYEPTAVGPVTADAPRVAVARDDAFCFYYQDSLDLLTALGAELVPFSPLADAALPANASGLLLGGGYPELHAAALSQNRPMRDALRGAVARGLPTIAECGGFLYLHRRLAGPDGVFHDMAGVIDAEAQNAGRLRRFGYVTLTAQSGGLLGGPGGQIAAHEFHYWDSTDCGGAFTARKPLRDAVWRCGHVTGSLYAGFPHLYLRSNERMARAFVARCAAFAKETSR